MSSRPGKREFRLEYSDRNGAVELSGHLADARRIQNVLFGHGRAGDSGLGVDAQSFVHELADATTRDRLAERARAQIMKYCPDVSINELAIDYLSPEQDPRGNKGGSVIIAVSIGAVGRPYEFALVAHKGTKSNIVSTLVL